MVQDVFWGIIMNINIDREKLSQLVKRFKSNIDYYKDNGTAYNEQSCRNEYIDPLLKILGWDVSNDKGELPQYREVIVEKFSNKQDRPDYSLTLRGITKLFVEAKKPSVDIISNPEPAIQTRKYGWNANHNIAVLTNFEYLIIYDTRFPPFEHDAPITARYRVFYYQNYKNQIEEIYKLISREAIYSGAFDSFFKENFGEIGRETCSVDKYFLKQINRWRLMLSENLYHKAEKYQNLEILNDVVQDFINKMVFLRICEDRKLPVYSNLKDVVKDEEHLNTILGDIFRISDRTYNAGLFSGEDVIFDLNNSVIKIIIDELYYPRSPYKFNIIDTGLLGAMYESFLVDKVCIRENKFVLEKKKIYANKAIVSTPNEIVKYIVEKTLHPLCVNKSPEEIKNLRIADISCGSGVFLEEAFEKLQYYCIEWYKKEDIKSLNLLSNGKYKLSLKEKKELLENCIFGVDIDNHAVDVAKFSLLVKLLEDEDERSTYGVKPILPDLSKNIVLGNSLISIKEMSLIKGASQMYNEITPFDWYEINNGAQFDAIIGNPPYVTIEGLYKTVSKMEIDLYKKIYRSAYKQYDKYFLFIERAINRIKNNGYIGFIIPNKFYKIVSGIKLRRLISNKKMVISLDDFGSNQLFSDKTVYSCILILSNNNQDEFTYSRVEKPVELWNGEPIGKLKLSYKNLGDSPWALTADFSFIQLLDDINRKAVKITKYINIFNGIQTSAERPDPIYWFSSSNIISEDSKSYKINKNDKIYTIEKSILRPYFKPTQSTEKKSNSYSIVNTDKWIIFPYDENGDLISIDSMKVMYPGVYSYLESYYNRLVPKQVMPSIGKRDVPNSTADTWYQYGRTQALTSFTNTRKLIVGILSKYPMYIYDTKDMLIASGGTAGYCAVTIKEDSPYELEYIQAWFSNDITERILSIIGSDFEGGFHSRGTAQLSVLPFIELDFTNNSQQRIYDNVVNYTREVYKINNVLSGNVTKADVIKLNRRKNELISEINDLISRVYMRKF